MSETRKTGPGTVQKTKLMNHLDSMLMAAKQLEIQFIIQKETELNARVAALEKERDRLTRQNASLAAKASKASEESALLRQDYDLELGSLLRDYEAELEKLHFQREDETKIREEIKDAYTALLQKNRAAQLRISELENRLKEAEEALALERSRDRVPDLDRALEDLEAFQAKGRDHRQQADHAFQELELAESARSGTSKERYLQRRLAESEKKIRLLTEQLKERRGALMPNG